MAKLMYRKKKQQNVLNNTSCFLSGGERCRRAFEKIGGREESCGKRNGFEWDILGEMETVFETARMQAIHYHAGFQPYVYCVLDEPLGII